jgi:hypothetical protein
LQGGYRSKTQSSTHIWLHVTSLAISFPSAMWPSCFPFLSLISLLCHPFPLLHYQNTNLSLSFLVTPLPPLYSSWHLFWSRLSYCSSVLGKRPTETRKLLPVLKRTQAGGHRVWVTGTVLIRSHRVTMRHELDCKEW